MNLLIEIITSAYARMLCFYPRKFREEFSSDMQVVFDDLVHDTAKVGLIPLLVVCFRESIHLPVSALREFWHELIQKERNMQTLQSQSATRSTGSWQDMVLSGLPHLLAAACIGVNKIFQSQPSQSASTIFLFVPLLIVLVFMVAYAGRQQWPLWSASWYGYWVWVGLVLPALGLSWLNAQLGIFVDWQFDNLIAIVVLLLPVIGLFWLFRKNRRKGLLAVLFLMPVLFPQMMLEFVPDNIEAWLAFCSGLVAALSAALIVHWENWGTEIRVALGGNLLVGTAYAYVKVYKLEVPAPGMHIINPPDLIINLFIFIMASAILIFGPLLFWKALGHRET